MFNHFELITRSQLAIKIQLQQNSSGKIHLLVWLPLLSINLLGFWSHHIQNYLYLHFFENFLLCCLKVNVNDGELKYWMDENVKAVIGQITTKMKLLINDLHSPGLSVLHFPFQVITIGCLMPSNSWFVYSKYDYQEISDAEDHCLCFSFHRCICLLSIYCILSSRCIPSNSNF